MKYAIMYQKGDDEMYPALELDLLEALDLSIRQPVIYFKLQVQPHISLDKLSKAVSQCVKFMPQWACRYDKATHCFVPLSTYKIIYEVDQFDFSTWDITKHPQLQIQIKHTPAYDELRIGCSHIVSDGNGAMQFLYLLCDCYNRLPITVHNERNLSSLPFIRSKKPQRKKPKAMMIKPEIIPHTSHAYILTQQIPLLSIQNIADHYQVTINDVCMCGYLLALYDVYHQESITIPCPVNLRAFLTNCPDTSITNFTGDYAVTIHDISQKHWQEILQDIHIQMKEERLRNDSLKEIQWYHTFYQFLPLSWIRFLAKKIFHNPMISYTNLGRFQDARMQLDDCEIINAYVMTAMRCYPCFQLTVSTYKNTCTFTANIQVNDQTLLEAKRLLSNTVNKIHSFEV